MQVFRLIREQYVSDPLSGRGAANFGARWNSIGVELVYTAANRSLAMAEVAVHLPIVMLPDDYLMVVVELPVDISIKTLEVGELPQRWSDFPYLAASQRIGDKFAADAEYCILQVPSVVTSGDFNYLINPHHPDFTSIRILSFEAFKFDKRLVK
ncbi:MAG TPA: RES family NAD+ phosphorylase [Pyrinomonadaceae bacterium]|nr:RES family NAD+ phosphorylase [Pyrinomonadaceae bacterium]